MTLTKDYINALKRAYRTSTEDNYSFLIQGLICRHDIPLDHEMVLRKNCASLDSFKACCKDFVVNNSEQTGPRSGVA